MSEPNFGLLEQGFIISLAVSIPVGPTSILCIQKAITKGIVSGLVSGMGAATAQTIHAGIGAVSLSLVTLSLAEHKGLFSFVSGVFLCYLGVQIFFDKSSIDDTHAKIFSRSAVKKNVLLLLGDYCSVLLLTLINPLAILPFVAFFTQAYTAANYPNYFWSGAFVFGVFVGCALWYGIVSVVVNLFPRGVLLCRLHWVNRISGTAIAVFGCISIHSVWI